MKLRNLFLGSLVLGFGAVAYAAGGASSGEIPVKTIILQCINFSIFFALMFYIGRKSIPPYLADFKSNYLEQAQIALSKYEEAKRTKEDLEKKIKDLNLTYKDTLSKAQAEAENMTRDKIASANSQANKMQMDLSDHIESLKRSYWVQLKKQLVDGSISELREEFSEKVEESVLKKLQEDFIVKMDARV